MEDLALGFSPWHGAGSLTYELKQDGGHSDTYRLFLTLRYKQALYILHCFKKKSAQGSKTPLKNEETVKVRSRWADRHWLDHYRSKPHQGGK